MSSVYVSEPNTKGKVIIQTSVGPLDVELWPKESPKAVRNFVQLCLEGYYDNTIFHRLVKDFIVQGGDPTGTGTGGESIYGGPFSDEFHQRLRFSHRGIVAMANLGQPHTNTSQFFITLGDAPELQNKHTIFGKVIGDTFFNIFKVNEMEVDENERPLYPPKILSIEVVWNPFDDIIPREKKAVQVEQTKVEKKRVALKKESRLLSIGEEVDEEEKVDREIKGVKAYLGKNKKKIDGLEQEQATEFPPHTESHTQAQPSEKIDSKPENVNNDIKKVPQPMKKEYLSDESEGEGEEEGGDYSFDQKMRDQILSKKKQFEKTKSQVKVDEKPKPDEKPKTAPKHKIKGSLTFKTDGGNSKKRKGDDRGVLAKLDSFKKTLQQGTSETKTTTASTEGESNEKNESEGWTNHSLQFPAEKPPKYKDDEEYVVKDPLRGDHKKMGNYHERRLGPKKLEKW
eukprot:TRINITY_DN1810_c0_g1_i1.p1 TRINITY_DN1810_c0_g1~~TRINITY_DN1810_c0_g1_i1.p1  ORF type:complete len:455 (+),score=107.12 TRINITY_DN1810_c0_g1_i1:958-2322(+)